MKILKISSLFVLLSLSLALAQTFTGNYILKDDVVKLTLEQNNSKVLGQLTGNGLSFDLEGELSPDSPTTAYGYLFTEDSNYLFAIVLEEPLLNMILFSILDNGEPNPDDAQTFVFNRIDDLGPNAANKQTNPSGTSTATLATTPTTATTETTAPKRLPTINSPSNTPTTDANTQTQTEASQKPLGANPLSAAPAAATGTESQNPLVLADPFNGIFEGDGLKLSLKKGGSSYSGSLEFRGNSYPVTAIKKANGLQGNFKAGDKSFSFSAAIENNKLTLVSDGAIYVLFKK